MLLLNRATVARWREVRRRLVEARTPTVILAPLSAEVLRLLAFERELPLVALHVSGVDDSAECLRLSLKRLLTRGILQRFLGHFGPAAAELESLMLPLWTSIGEIRSIREWGTLIGRAPDTLVRKLHRLGVRRPRRLLGWLRLLRAWPELQAGQAVTRVALDVGYSTPPAFTRSTWRLVGVNPSAAHALPLKHLVERAAADLVA